MKKHRDKIKFIILWRGKISSEEYTRDPQFAIRGALFQQMTGRPVPGEAELCDLRKNIPKPVVRGCRLSGPGHWTPRRGSTYGSTYCKTGSCLSATALKPLLHRNMEAMSVAMGEQGGFSLYVECSTLIPRTKNKQKLMYKNMEYYRIVKHFS